MCYNFATFVLYLDVITLIYRENRLTSSEPCLSAGKQLFGCFFVFMEGDDSDILKRKRGVSNVFIEF